MISGCDAEMETGAVADTGRKGNFQLMLPELLTASLASEARLGPGFTPAAARMARAAQRHLKRQHGAEARFSLRHLDRGAERGRPLVGDERAPHPIDSRSHGRKVDSDLVGETAPVLLASAAKRKAPDSPRRVSTHEQ
jgi:hypothetical protein